jgi:hypothetical protein
MIRVTQVLVAVALSCALPSDGHAQGPVRSVLWERSPPLVSESSELLSYSDPAPDYRWEGLAIGAGAGAIAFALLGAAVCAQSESGGDCIGPVLGVGLIGALAGGVTGGLIGGAITKGEPADSTPQGEWADSTSNESRP